MLKDSFKRLTGSIPDFFGRFIDDCSSTESHSRTDLERFINFVHDFHPVLTFTWEISESCVPVSFLDILVSINGDTLRTLVFYKPINSHRYLLFSYCHPNHIKKSIPYSQFLSLDHLCSDDRDFETKSEKMRYCYEIPIYWTLPLKMPGAIHVQTLKPPETRFS